MKKTHMKENEMEIIRAVSVDLGDGLMFVLSYQYHTELNPTTGRNDRTKSRYRMIGRVDTKENFDKLYLETRKDENRLNPWKWPDDPSWTGSILYMNDATNAGFSNWLRLKTMKAVGWDEYSHIVRASRRILRRRLRTRSGRISSRWMKSTPRITLRPYTRQKAIHARTDRLFPSWTGTR